jgi:membrane dipeptidase
MTDMIVDCHNDMVLELARRELLLGEPDAFRERWLDPLRTGGVGLQVCPLYAASELVPDGALRETLNQLLVMRHAVARNADTIIAVECREDLDEVRDGRRLGLMLSMEGLEALGRDPWLIEVFRDMGVRMASLTWEYRNFFADGTGEGPDGGLSKLGRVMVRLMADLGIVIDLAHASARTFWDVLKEVPEAPIVVSHAGCRAVYDIPRNVDDDQLRALAERDGVFCVMLLPYTLGEGAFFERACAHVLHAVEVMGAGHVGLGGDFIEQVEALIPGPVPLDALFGFRFDDALAGAEMGGPGDYPMLVEHLRPHLGADELTDVLSGSLLSFFSRTLPSRTAERAGL